jgi:hypothetical protein
MENQAATFKIVGESNIQVTETDEAKGQQNLHLKVVAIIQRS